MRVPSERSEQIALVKHLKHTKLKFFAVPNGGERPKKEAYMMVAEGLKSGVPDLMFVDPPPFIPGAVGTCIEMKKINAVPSDTSPNQLKWHKILRDRGWFVFVAKGCSAAIAGLREIGYEV
jgi:hypothetical protein